MVFFMAEMTVLNWSRLARLPSRRLLSQSCRMLMSSSTARSAVDSREEEEEEAEEEEELETAAVGAEDEVEAWAVPAPAGADEE